MNGSDGTGRSSRSRTCAQCRAQTAKVDMHGNCADCQQLWDMLWPVAEMLTERLSMLRPEHPQLAKMRGLAVTLSRMSGLEPPAPPAPAPPAPRARRSQEHAPSMHERNHVDRRAWSDATGGRIAEGDD